MNLEQLLEQYNKVTFEKEHFMYNDLGDFAIWLGHKGYRLNNAKPLDFALTHGNGRADEFIENNNIILTHVRHELEIIQFMQDRGLTFVEMSNLTLRLQDNITTLINKK